MEKNLKIPNVTVLMPVYNAGRFLAEAIESVLRQTYANFEFLIIDDGSNDDSLRIIQKYAKKDSRIRVISRVNKGLVATLNEGVRSARGEYIARQDADDISIEHRLEKQIEYLNTHPSIGLLGTNYHVVDESGKALFASNVFTCPSDLRLAEIFSNQFGHGTVMIRKSLLSEDPYDQRYEHAEDYDLWSRLSHETKIANLKSALYMWRQHSKGVTAEHEPEMDAQVHKIRAREFNYFIKNKTYFISLFIHPKSARGGIKKYFEMKNTMYRDMALMYCYNERRIASVVPLVIAVMHAPWVKRTYSQLAITLFRKSLIKTIKYEYI